MKRLFPFTLFLLCYSLNLNAQTTYSVSDVYRVVESYSLDDPYNQAFMPYGGELPQLLMDAGRSGAIQAYTFNDFMSSPISFDDINERMIMEEQYFEDPWEDDWGYGWYESWSDTYAYNEGDIVEYEGMTYVSLTDENEGNDPVWFPEFWSEYEGTVYYFLDTDLRDLKVEYMIGMKKGKIKFKQPLFLHFSIPADNTVEGFQKYIVSFSFEDCIQVLNDHNIVWHQFANPDWGFVAGEIFLWNDWGSKQGKFATDLLHKISSGELGLPDSIGEEDIPNLDEFLEIEVEEEPYTFSIRKVPDQPGIVQIMHSYWSGFSGADYLTTVNIGSLLQKFSYTEGFMSYGQALMKGKLEPVPGSTVDTISHNGMLIGQHSSIGISEIKSVEMAQNQFPDYQQGVYSLVVSEMADLSDSKNSILFDSGNEISRIIIDKVRNGELISYTSDSLTVQMTLEEFDNKLIQYYGDFVDDFLWLGGWDESLIYSAWEVVVYNENEYESLIDENLGNIPDESPEAWAPRTSESYEHDPSEASMLQITYRYNFDEQGKIISSEPIAIGLNISPEFEETGLMTPIGSFDFEKVERAFENEPAATVSHKGESVKMTDIIRDHQLLTFHYSSRYIEYVED